MMIAVSQDIMWVVVSWIVGRACIARGAGSDRGSAGQSRRRRAAVVEDPDRAAGAVPRADPLAAVPDLETGARRTSGAFKENTH